jgi:hypothetical protein
MPIHVLLLRQMLGSTAVWLLYLNETENLCSHMNVIARFLLLNWPLFTLRKSNSRWGSNTWLVERKFRSPVDRLLIFLRNCNLAQSAIPTVMLLRHGSVLSSLLLLAAFVRQHNNKNKTVELLTLVLFDSCYLFRSTFGRIFRQSHQIGLLLLNCTNMDPC